VIAVDTNILVYAYNRRAPEHEAAAAAMAKLAAEPAWGLPVTVACEFYAVVTNPRLWLEPSVDTALAALDAWLATPGARLLGDPPGLWSRLRPMLAAPGTVGRQVHDARIAATCLAHGVTELWTLDRDYSWYPQLRTHNPLVG
jgi:toxin-antitoxin system PIN domain toxin